MAEAHHAAIAEDEIETGRRHREDQNAGEQREQEIIAGDAGIDRKQNEECQQAGNEEIAGVARGDHLLDTGNRPSGRNTSTAAINR